MILFDFVVRALPGPQPVSEPSLFFSTWGQTWGPKLGPTLGSEETKAGSARPGVAAERWKAYTRIYNRHVQHQHQRQGYWYSSRWTLAGEGKKIFFERNWRRETQGFPNP